MFLAEISAVAVIRQYIWLVCLIQEILTCKDHVAIDNVQDGIDESLRALQLVSLPWPKTQNAKPRWC